MACCALLVHCHCRFLKGILVSNFREAAAGQKHVVGIHNDLANIFAELSQNLAGAPSNALLVGLLRQAAPRKMKTNVWARLRGQKEQLTIKVLQYLCTATPMNRGVIWDAGGFKSLGRQRLWCMLCH